MIRIVSFNIRTSAAFRDLHHHWTFRKGAVVSTLERLNADVIGLQEARNAPLVYIREHLKNYESVAAGRDNGLTKGEAVPLLVRNGFNIESHETRWLSDTPDVAGSKFPNVSLPRICTIARVRDNGSGETIAFANTHLDTQFRNVREQSLELIHKWAEADSVPWVIMGDFNCPIDSPEMAPLLSNGWSDGLTSIPKAGTESATYNGFKNLHEGSRIDHVLVPNGIKVQTARIDNDIRGAIPSDHWPVVVELEI